MGKEDTGFKGDVQRLPDSQWAFDERRCRFSRIFGETSYHFDNPM